MDNNQKKSTETGSVSDVACEERVLLLSWTERVTNADVLVLSQIQKHNSSILVTFSDTKLMVNRRKTESHLDRQLQGMDDI